MCLVSHSFLALFRILSLDFLGAMPGKRQRAARAAARQKDSELAKFVVTDVMS